MKQIFGRSALYALVGGCVCMASLSAADRPASTVILDAMSADNLGVRSVVAERRLFEETLFALGRTEPIPARQAVVSSRVAGRVISLFAFEGDEVVVQGAYPLAYTGAGTVSLKEALDAAHGHEHNEDGSEMTAEDREKAQSSAAVANGGLSNGGTNLFLALLAGVLLILVVLTQVQLYQLKREKGNSDA